MNGILPQIGALMRSTPTTHAQAAEVADWYEAKAVLFSRIAQSAATPPREALRLAKLARDARGHAELVRAEAVAHLDEDSPCLDHTAWGCPPLAPVLTAQTAA